MDKGTRDELLAGLAGAIESVTTSHPLRVAVDGPPAAGKTTPADELLGKCDRADQHTRPTSVFEADQPEQAVLIPHLAVAGAPRTDLKVVNDRTVFRKRPEPGGECS
jgi:hypothetical protein